MWKAASTSTRRATYQLVAAVLTLMALVVATAVDATPKAPSELRVTSSTENSLSLSWTAAREHGSHVISGYHVYLGDALQRAETGADLVDGTSFEFVALQCGTTYTLGVEAVDGDGSTSRIGTLKAATSPCPSDASPAPGDTTPDGASAPPA